MYASSIYIKLYEPRITLYMFKLYEHRVYSKISQMYASSIYILNSMSRAYLYIYLNSMSTMFTLKYPGYRRNNNIRIILQESYPFPLINN